MSTQSHPTVGKKSPQQQILEHPYVQQAARVTSEQMDQLDQVLARFPALNEFEKQTKVKKTHATLGVGAIVFVAIWFNFLGSASPVSNLIGFLIPAYLSLKALESPSKDDDKIYLTYWITFGLFNFIESAALRPVLYYFPFYFVFKLLFTIWLWLPATRGADTLYRNVVRPVFLQLTSAGGNSRASVGSRAQAAAASTFDRTTTSFEHEKSL